ncbi:MerR family DNA-binding transcriptional regulator [Massilia cellulosiltytica]|uniref:MerR family transcriptional regulator n=1 Tax=Massilia cellulosiltytica TaxID=2683234 RepID=UPI0039B433F8
MEKAMGKSQAARLLGITVKTLQRSEREGRLVPAARATSNRRCYVHCFSSRLYGLRNYRRQLRAALESDHAAGASDQD